MSGYFVTSPDPFWVLSGHTLSMADPTNWLLLDCSGILFDCPIIQSPGNPSIDWGDGRIEDAGSITLSPLGGGLNDNPQIAAALATGKIVILSPGTWNLGGVVTVYTQAQELHGPAPADDGVVRLSYSDAITLESSDATGRWALNTYDATFFGVVDHTARWGFNNGAGGTFHDTTLPQFGIQLEATFNTAAIGPVQSEFFVQYSSPGGAVERRPIECDVVHATNECATTISGQFAVHPDGVALARFSIPNSAAGAAVLNGQVNFMDDTGGHQHVSITSWALVLYEAVQICGLGTLFNINWADADTGHGTAPVPMEIYSQNNTHADTPLTGYVHFNNPLIKNSYTVAELNAAPMAAAKAKAGAEAFCTNETGGAVPVFSDGTNWRRVTDRAIIS
jgi:hypothetical protein